MSALSNILLLDQGHLPFAVVGSMDEVKVGNKMVKARQYPWGTVQGMTCIVMFSPIAGCPYISSIRTNIFLRHILVHGSITSMSTSQPKIMMILCPQTLMLPSLVSVLQNLW